MNSTADKPDYEHKTEEKIGNIEEQIHPEESIHREEQRRHMEEMRRVEEMIRMEERRYSEERRREFGNGKERNSRLGKR